jgi:hypothetical protein
MNKVGGGGGGGVVSMPACMGMGHDGPHLFGKEGGSEGGYRGIIIESSNRALGGSGKGGESLTLVCWP